MVSFKRTQWVLAVSAALALGGCGGGGDQDDGESTNNARISGVVVDGYLARALVWADSDGDAALDAFEARALTDDQGYFTYNPVTDTDYCADSATEQQARHCLEANLGSGTVLRMTGGYDVTNGEPFQGMLTLRLSGAASGVVGSPLTALMATVDSDDRRQALLSRLVRPLAGNQALAAAETGTDFLDTRNGGSIDTTDQDLIRLALTAHKAVSAMADLLDDRYDELGNDPGLPVSASAAVYQALVAGLLDSSMNLLDFAQDRGALAAVMTAAEQDIRQLYQAEGLSLPGALSSSAIDQRAARVVRMSQAVASVIDNIVSNTSLAGSVEQKVRGGMRAIEIVLRKIIDEDLPIPDDDYADAADWIDNAPGDIVALGDDSTARDIGVLIETDMDPSDGTQSSEAEVPADAVPLTDFVGGRLQMALSGETESGAALSYFQGDSGDRSGPWVGCIRFNDTDDDDPLETEGSRFTGDWSFPSPSNDYSAVMSVRILGTEQAMQLKSVGRNQDTNDAIFEFDYAGDPSRWEGNPVPQSVNGDIPATDAECAQRLNEVFGPA